MTIIKGKMRIVHDKIRFWVFKHLNNGVIYLAEGTDETLEHAQSRVRRGGYIIVIPTIGETTL